MSKKKSTWRQRWKNRRPDGTYVSRGDNWTAWRNQTCPTCGRKYRDFRMSMSREDVLFTLRQESDNGDISTVTLRTFLGRCHEIKMREWDSHLLSCEWNAAWVRGDVSDAEMEEFYLHNRELGSFIQKKQLSLG